jgi:bifunctional enzyme CysN/CysC
MRRDFGCTHPDRLMVDAGIVVLVLVLVLVSFILPFRTEREMAGDLLGEGEFVEIHIDAQLEIVQERDGEGLHAGLLAHLSPATS